MLLELISFYTINPHFWQKKVNFPKGYTILLTNESHQI